jgi:hypothetical protein
MFDVNLLLTIGTLLLVAVTWITDYFQWRGIRSINSKVEAYESTDPGEAFGQWLLRKEKLEDGSEVTNLESCASLVGRQIAGSFKMGLAGIQSGEARIVKNVQNKVVAALQTPETKALMEFCDRAGIPEEYATVAYQLLDKMGMLPQALRNNGQGQTASW